MTDWLIKKLGHGHAMHNHTCNFQQNTLTSLFSVGLILSANLLLEGTTFPAISAVGSIKSRPGGALSVQKRAHDNVIMFFNNVHLWRSSWSQVSQLYVWLCTAYLCPKFFFESICHLISRLFAPELSLFHGNWKAKNRKRFLLCSVYIPRYRLPRPSFGHV